MTLLQNEITVSVIIPIYNVKEFINRGLTQLLNQSYKNYEIILVDDGSTDGSLEECKKWEMRDSRIKVLHQENTGAGGARNLGIENALGRYIYFYDIDDTISSDLLERNVAIVDKYKVEMVIFGYKNVDLTYNSETTVTFPEKLIEDNSQLRDIYVDQFVLKVNGFPWNKFYNKEFLNKHQLRFENQRIQQDEVFNLLCYKHVEKMFLSPDVLYTYYVYKSGNTRSRYIPDRFDIYKSVREHFEELKRHWNIEDQRFDDYLSKRFYDGVMSCMLFNLMHSNCPLSNDKKKQCISEIMTDPYTVEALNYAKEANLGIEQNIYILSCESHKLWLIKLVASIFTKLRSLSVKLKTYKR